MKEKKLNQNQQKAAQYMGDALCILASAGCGKTTVLVAHYLELLKQKKLRPSQIVVTTFSEKSAADIKQKILKELETFSDQALLEEFLQAPISTLHSLAGRILRDTSLLLGLEPHFEILDENKSATLKIQSLREVMEKLLEEASPLLHSLIKAYGWKRTENEFFKMLSEWPEWKDLFDDSRASPCNDLIEKDLKLAFREIFLKILENYSAKKTSQEVLDFNDLEEKSIQLLQKYPWVLKHYQRQWKAYLIDEFQDTSGRQDLLLSLLLNVTPDHLLLSDTHLAIVGDPKQSIYGFRGAKAHLFEKYQSMIEKKGGITVYLDENYRSPSSILEFVNHLFKPIFPNYSELRGPLYSSQAIAVEGEALWALPMEGATQAPIIDKRKQEAEFMAQHIQKLLQEGNKAHEIFLLFRSSTPMPLYLKAFRKKNLPVFVKSGESLLERQEIQDLLHAMRVVVNPKDSLAWIGLLRSPACSLSDESLLEYSLDHEQKADWSQIHPFAQKLLEQNKNSSPTRFLEEYFEHTQIISIYSAEPSLAPKAQNILQFYNFCFEWEREHSGNLENFLCEIDMLIQEGIGMNALSDSLGTGDAITFMTIHQSKGLDLPLVILPDLKANSHKPDHRALVCKGEKSWGIRLPKPTPGLKKSLQATELFEDNLQQNNIQQEEEENRIFYVATTRSTQKLILGFLPPPPTKNKEETLLNARNRLEEVCKSFPQVQWIFPEPAPQSTKQIENTIPKIENFPRFSQNKLLHFAVTQLETFLRSPQEYKERFIENISAESLSPRFGQKKSNLSALEKGQILHEALCWISEQNNSLSSNEIIRALAAKHHWTHNLEDEILSLESTFQKITEHSSLQKILKAEEGYSEIAFRLKLEPFVIQGAMDRLIREKDQWKVIDYKTHAASATTLPPPKEFEFQLKTYCLAASKMLHRPVQQAQVYFVFSHKTHSYFFNETDLKIHEEKLWNLMQEINEFVYALGYGSPNSTNIGVGG